VPHLRIEAAVADILGGPACVVTGVPDQNRGERLALLYADSSIAPRELWRGLSQTGLPALLKNFMLEQLGIPNTPELDLKLRVVSEAGERLIAYAFQQPTVNDRVRIITEMKHMLSGYLFGGN